MKASRFSDTQKAFILKQGADGVPVKAFEELQEKIETHWVDGITTWDYRRDQ
jgi:hypothetical protein